MALLEDLGHDGDVLAIRERAKGGAYSPETLAWFEKEIAPKFTRTGRLYEVNIHADPESFLDWDKPLSQQPEKVQKALAKYGAVDGEVHPPIGSQAYEKVVDNTDIKKRGSLPYTSRRDRKSTRLNSSH